MKLFFATVLFFFSRFLGGEFGGWTEKKMKVIFSLSYHRKQRGKATNSMSEKNGTFPERGKEMAEPRLVVYDGNRISS